jgi:hypothetical protein
VKALRSGQRRTSLAETRWRRGQHLQWQPAGRGRTSRSRPSRCLGRAAQPRSARRPRRMPRRTRSTCAAAGCVARRGGAATRQATDERASALAKGCRDDSDVERRCALFSLPGALLSERARARAWTAAYSLPEDLTYSICRKEAPLGGSAQCCNRHKRPRQPTRLVHLDLPVNELVDVRHQLRVEERRREKGTEKPHATIVARTRGPSTSMSTKDGFVAARSGEYAPVAEPCIGEGSALHSTRCLLNRTPSP